MAPLPSGTTPRPADCNWRWAQCSSAWPTACWAAARRARRDEARRILAAAWHRDCAAWTPPPPTATSNRAWPTCAAVPVSHHQQDHPTRRPARCRAAASPAVEHARSIERLGHRLDALMFHSAADLLSPQGDALWAIARATSLKYLLYCWNIS